MYLQVLNLLVSLLRESKMFFWPFSHDLICQESDKKWKEKEGGRHAATGQRSDSNTGPLRSRPSVLYYLSYQAPWQKPNL